MPPFCPMENQFDMTAFRSARPIWPAGRETEQNLIVGFRAVIDVDESEAEPLAVSLRMIGSTVYRVYVNGEFTFYGPARGPHGYYRLDEIDLSDRITSGANLIAVEIAGYNIDTQYTLDQPSFLQAEVISDGHVLASTGGDGVSFDAVILPERVQDVPRYTFQRGFTEEYHLTPGFDAWKMDKAAEVETAECAVCEDKEIIPRRIPLPEFVKYPPVRSVARGSFTPGIIPGTIWLGDEEEDVDAPMRARLEKEQATSPCAALQCFRTDSREELDTPLDAGVNIELAADSYHIVDFGTNLSGFMGFRVSCTEDTTLYVSYDEILTDGEVNFRRLGCISIICYHLAPGKYDLEVFEPYTLSAMKLHALGGACTVQDIYIRDYSYPDVHRSSFSCSDRDLNRIFRAGVETFRQNSVDLFMDCPSRERSAWLCDGFFTSRVADDLCPDTNLEKNFLENYLLPPFPYLPEGMLPRCYPADHRDGDFIPTWSLWFVIQLEEYLARSGDRELVDALKPKVQKLFGYFKNFENEFELLENLEKWVFIEWSKANDYPQDVNYPANMVFSGALAAAGRMYDLDDLTQKAERIRNVIREQSFDGEFFVDNAVREDGVLNPTRNRTEVCQYYAFFFGTATPELHPELWKVMSTDFGPYRNYETTWPEISKANAFIGNYLRLEILSRHGINAQAVKEVNGYFLKMADMTGTLWEVDNPGGSLNHGFASHVNHVMYRDALGIVQVDAPNRTVAFELRESDLAWCEGVIPVGNDAVEASWWREDGEVHYQVRVPAGYTLSITNPKEIPAVRHA